MNHMIELLNEQSTATQIETINDPSILAVPVNENGEQLAKVVHSRILLPSKISTDTGLTDGSDMLRKSVVKALEHAADSLPDTYGLVLIEGTRTFAQQEQLFQDEVNKIITKSGMSVDAESAISLAEKYVANPDKYAPHVTGGAVDVSLIKLKGAVNEKQWELCDVGNNLFKHDDTAHTDYAGLTTAQIQNRALLKSVMENAGFTNYPQEFWHYSMGDKMDAFVKGTNAVFGELK